MLNREVLGSAVYSDQEQLRNELINSTPFLVRAHHLALLTPVVQTDTPSGQLVQEIMQGVETFAKHEQGYITDVLGTTLQEREVYHANLTRYFDRFRSLRPDFPVRIVTDEIDGICASCVKGNHCRKKYPTPVPARAAGVMTQPTTVSPDMTYVGKFLAQVMKIDLDGKLAEQIKQGSSDSVSTELIHQTPITTTAQVVRQILESW